ncbi:MAG: YraN family protein [Clostridia bacterium]|nr:YraN family protein [Clostridia bacterium]
MPDTQKDFRKKLLGIRGENLALKKLKKSGYKLIKRNFFTPFGEADLIVGKGGAIVFVEVKTRSGDQYGDPKDAVDGKKRDKYYKIAQYYAQKYGEGVFSFAVAEVRGNEVNVIEDAF